MEGRVSMVELDDDNTAPTADDGLLRQLRASGILGPFEVDDWAGGTETGQVRQRNEDRWGHVGTTTYVLADGVGGNAGGELAAQTAVEVVLKSTDVLTEASAGELVVRANGAVLHAAELNDLSRPGSTLVVLAVHENHVIVVSVGDSRAYRFRDGELEQLTRDHSVRNELLASGVSLELIKDRQIRLNALTSYIGLRSYFAIPINVASFSVMAGDRFLLCSDGVHGQVTQEAMVDAMSLESCDDCVTSLLNLANEAGGRDNATAIVLELNTRGTAS